MCSRLQFRGRKSYDEAVENLFVCRFLHTAIRESTSIQGAILRQLR